MIDVNGPWETLQWVVYAAYGFIMAAVGIVTAFVGSFILGSAGMLFSKGLSKAAIVKIRVIFGLVGATGAYLMLGNPGFGLGGGGGLGLGVKDGSLGNPPAPAHVASTGREPPTKTTDDTATKGNVVVRIQVLGEKTQPPHQEKDRFFAMLNDSNPQAVDVEGVLKRIEELRAAGTVQEVELVVSEHSTSLQNIQVQRLRRALQQAGLKTFVPDVEDPNWTPNKPK